MKIISLFSGCGGLDLGFESAGFEIVYANDNWTGCWETYEKGHNVKIDKRSIINIKSDEIPNADGIVGSCPCQPWSLAGNMQGASDSRGRVFYEYVRVIHDKKPLFFLTENVPGLISSAHMGEFQKIINEFNKIGYNVSYKLVNAKDYGVPQERKRVIIVGYRKDINKKFEFPAPTSSKTENTLYSAIGDMPKPLWAADGQPHPKHILPIDSHEYAVGGFSSIFMSRNRRKEWSQPGFTVQASGRHTQIHPSSPKMAKIDEKTWKFENNVGVRRMSIRECARLQTFSDSFVLYYTKVNDGYKMVGNAVPVKLAEAMAKKIQNDFK